MIKIATDLQSRRLSNNCDRGGVWHRLPFQSDGLLQWVWTFPCHAGINFRREAGLIKELLQKAAFVNGTLDPNYISGDLVLVSSAADSGLVELKLWGSGMRTSPFDIASVCCASNGGSNSQARDGSRTTSFRMSRRRGFRKVRLVNRGWSLVR